MGVVEWRHHGQDRIDQAGEIRAGRGGVGRVHRRIELRRGAHGRHAGEVASGGEADDADAVCIDAGGGGGARTMRMARWPSWDGASGGQPSSGSGRPVRRRWCRRPAATGGRGAFHAGLDMRIAAAGDDEGGRAVGMRGPIDDEPRARHARDIAIGAALLRAWRCGRPGGAAGQRSMVSGAAWARAAVAAAVTIAVARSDRRSMVVRGIAWFFPVGRMPGERYTVIPEPRRVALVVQDVPPVGASCGASSRTKPESPGGL